jgi:hypothetical protein
LRYNVQLIRNDENRKHLAAHKVTQTDFEQLMNNDPLDVDWELINNEERYRSIGITNRGRLLSVIWTFPRSRSAL